MQDLLSQNSQYILNALITEVSDVVWVKDKNGAYILINEAGAHFFKRTIQDIVGKTDYDLFAPETVEKIRRTDLEVIESGGSKTVEDTLLTLDGSKRTFLAVKSVYRDDDGAIQGVLGIIRDITDRKQMEEELKLAKEVAEEANRRKEMFLANMSHELRTPLHNIITSSKIALSGIIGDLNEKTLEYFSLISKSGTHLLTLIDDLLDVSKINAGKFTVSMSPIDTIQYLEESVDLIRPLMESKYQQFKLEIDDDVPAFFFGDFTRLKQSLCNLLSNAHKFTAEHKQIQLLCGYDTDAKMLKFTVKDEGSGIHEDDMERITEPFEQGERTQKAYIKGTGLGLALVKSIVEMHGGTLQIESTLNVGSSFSMVLPLKPESME